MDQFVQDQLKLLGFGDLIPVFEAEGYNEQSYRELNRGKLMRLFPDEDNEDLIDKILENIISLNERANGTDSAEFQFPGPQFIIKTEQPESEGTQATSATSASDLNHPNDDDDDIQIEKIIINAPSAFTRVVRIKSESLGPNQDGSTASASSSSPQGPIVILEGATIKQEQEDRTGNQEPEISSSTSGNGQNQDSGVFDETITLDDTTGAGCSVSVTSPSRSPLSEENSMRSRLRKRCQKQTSSTPQEQDGSIRARLRKRIQGEIAETSTTPTPHEDGNTARRLRKRGQTETSGIPSEEEGNIRRRLRKRCQPETPDISTSSTEERNKTKRLRKRGQTCQTETLGRSLEGDGNTSKEFHKRGQTQMLSIPSGGGSIRGRLRRRVLKVNILPPQEPQHKIRKINISNRRRWKHIQLILAAANRDSVRRFISDKLDITFSNVDHFDEALEVLETHSGKLSNVIRHLEFYLTTPERDLSSLQVNRLSNLPESFWCQLTTLIFKLTFPETTEFTAISNILKKCPNLKKFEIRRGVDLSGTDVKYIEIPRLDKLEIFLFGNEMRLGTIPYWEPNPVVDVEADEYENEDAIVYFEVKFGKCKYPKLEILFVGPSINLDFQSLAQFPKLQRFEPGHIRNRMLWEPKMDGPVFDNLLRLYLPAGITADIIESLPHTFPNLGALGVVVPKVDVLRSMIRCLASMRLRVIELTVTYEFESALVTALRGQRFRVVTRSDMMKLAKLQAYKKWKSFVAFLKMEIPPTHEDEGTDHDIHQESGAITIGSFKHLETFHVHYLPRSVFMPEGDLHWNDPKVKVSKEQWSSKKQNFPACILLEELTKLKTLKDVNLPDFQVDTEVANEFNQRMGFKLRFDGVPEDRTTDGFVEAELDVVKQERQ